MPMVITSPAREPVGRRPATFADAPSARLR